MTDRPRPERDAPDRASGVGYPSGADRTSAVDQRRPAADRQSPDRGRAGNRPAETPVAQADAVGRRTGEGTGLRTPSSLEMTPALRSHLDNRALRAQAGGGIGRGGASAVRETGAGTDSGDRRGGDDRRNDVSLDRRLDRNDRRIPDNDRRQATEPFSGEDRRQGDRREPDADRRQDHDRRAPGADRREPAKTDEPGGPAPHRTDSSKRRVDDTRAEAGAEKNGSPSGPSERRGESVRADKADDMASGNAARYYAAGDHQSPLTVGNAASKPTDANGQTPLVNGSRSEPGNQGRLRAAGESLKDKGGAMVLAGAILWGSGTPDKPGGDMQARPHRADDESGHVIRAPAEPRVELQDVANKVGELADAGADALKRRREVEDATDAARQKDQPGKSGAEHQPDHGDKKDTDKHPDSENIGKLDQLLDKGKEAIHRAQDFGRTAAFTDAAAANKTMESVTATAKDIVGRKEDAVKGEEPRDANRPAKSGEEQFPK